jgi:hypothetical protein
MSVPVSTVPSAVNQLQILIAAQANTDSLPILVQIGDLSLDLPNDYITIGQIRRQQVPETFIGGGGQYWLNETYEVDVVASTWTGAGVEQALALTQRAWTLVGYIETAVRTDPSLGGVANNGMAYPLQSTTEGPVFSEQPVGLMVNVTVPIRVEVLN